MIKIAWAYATYSAGWSAYTDFKRNPGSTPIEKNETSTGEFRRLIDGSEVQLIPENEYLPEPITLIWPLQRDDQIHDLIQGWLRANTGVRIRDDNGDIFEGRFTSLRRIRDQRTSTIRGENIYFLNTQFKRIVIS